jgi:nitrogen fixation NifU-like protein
MDDDMRELYQEVILDHGKNPRNFRQPEDANCEARGNNPLCGDQLTVYLKVDEGRLIRDAAFEGRGCAISMASASMMTQIVCGKTVSQVQSLFDKFHKLCTGEMEEFPQDEFTDDMEKLRVMSGVRRFPMRVKCATLSWHTMNAAASGHNETTTE